MSGGTKTNGNDVLFTEPSTLTTHLFPALDASRLLSAEFWDDNSVPRKSDQLREFANE